MTKAIKKGYSKMVAERMNNEDNNQDSLENPPRTGSEPVVPVSMPDGGSYYPPEAVRKMV